MGRMTLGALISMTFLATHALAETCPSWAASVQKTLPNCEANGLVPEHNPVGALVVSSFGGLEGQRFTADVVMKTLKAAGPHLPQIYLPVDQSTLDYVKTQIRTSHLDGSTKDKWLASLTHVETHPYTWQQDYMQSFVDPVTGAMMVRKVESYSRNYGGFEALSNTAKNCIQTGPVLGTSTPWEVAGEYGGNIDALPGGICLLGDDHFNGRDWEKYANQFCGTGPFDRIRAPTRWLSVGHTDEIFKVVKNTNEKSPCDFSVVLASPKKALEVLAANPTEKYFQPAPGFAERMGMTPRDLLNSRLDQYSGFRRICNAFNALGTTETRDQTPARSKPIMAENETSETDREPAASKTCAEITNADVLNILKNDNILREYNEEVQKTMDEFKKEIEAKVKAKNLACQNVSFIDAPDLFFGGTVVRNGTRRSLPSEVGLSILPNPTNAITVGNTVIMPDQMNNSFRKYMEGVYAKNGLKTEFVDTYHQHANSGNLHCSTQTFHLCNPVAKGRQ